MKKSTILKVLLVEDEPISQRIAEKILFDGYDCVIDVAQTALETLTVINDMSFEIASSVYDVILMDIYLPDMNGDVLTQIIRTTEEKAKSTPIIAVTSYASDEEQAEFKAMGITDILFKPITAEKLDDMLKKHGCLV